MSADRDPITPLDGVELAHMFVGLAGGVWSFYSGLIEEGFEAAEAMKITLTYVHAVAGGKDSP